MASGQNSNLTSNDMDYIRRQGISFDDDNDSAIVKILDEVPQPENVLQLEIIRNHFSEAINQFYTTPMRLSEKYSREEVMNMMNLEFF